MTIQSVGMILLSSYEAAGFRILSTRRELVELMKDFKETYPDANITVMKS